MNLNAINSFASASGSCPWSLSFSYGRALQASVLQAWRGDVSNVRSAQETLLKRARANGDAQQGKFKQSGEESDTSLYVEGYTY